MDGVPAALIWFIAIGGPAFVLVAGILLLWKASSRVRWLAMPLVALSAVALLAGLRP